MADASKDGWIGLDAWKGEGGGGERWIGDEIGRKREKEGKEEGTGR